LVFFIIFEGKGKKQHKGELLLLNPTIYLMELFTDGTSVYVCNRSRK